MTAKSSIRDLFSCKWLRFNFEIYVRPDLDPVRKSVNTATNTIMEAARLNKTADVLPLQRKR